MSDIRRIIGDYPKGHEETTVADHWGIGCMREFISFALPEEQTYLCDREKKMADMVLEKNKNIWPAVVFLPSGLSPELIYAQCSFPIRTTDDHNYKEASGLNNFLKKDGVLPFMRKYNVSSLIVCSANLADGLSRLDEPRIEESLFVVKTNTFKAERYHGLKKLSGRGNVTAEQAKTVERLAIESQSASKRAAELRNLQKPPAPPVRCPLCGWSPCKDDRWSCKCLHLWNTFDTGGVCPACAYQWTVTTCLSCKRQSPHSDWYKKVDEAPLAGSQSASERVNESRKPQKPVAASVHSIGAGGKVETDQPGGIRGFFKRLFG